MQQSTPLTLETLASLCKRRGYIYQSSELYGGINGFWDYGPLGCELKRNVKEQWWRAMVQQREDVVGLDATIIMHPVIWKASGHLDTFADPMSMCRGCRKLLRSDQMWDIFLDNPLGKEMATLFNNGNPEMNRIINWCKGPGKNKAPNLAAVLATSPEEFVAARGEKIKSAENVKYFFAILAGDSEGAAVLPCPYCGGALTEPRPFNLMFKTVVGPVDDPSNIAYLRPETAQAIFVQFQNVLATSRQKVPFGIAQIGKAFRNEVTPRNYTFRSREFEQMELEFFIRPDEAVELICGKVATLADDPDLSEPAENWGWEVWHKYWVKQRRDWFRRVGLPDSSLVEYWQKGDELAHYARACVDVEFAFPFGVQELEGIAARSDFDLTQHQRQSGKPMDVFDEPLKLAADKLSEAEKLAFSDKVVTLWSSQGKASEDALAFCAKLFEGRYIPHVIEPSAGVDRLALALLCNAYAEEKLADDKGKEDVRTVLRLHPLIAPVKIAVFPLVKNKPELYGKARAIFAKLQRRWNCFWDESGAIGRRYRRQDEAGTPYCVTVDFQTLEDDTVTLRERDSMKQERLTITALINKMDEILT